MTWDAEKPLDRAVLETARSWGVSPSRLLGAERKSVTVYTHDASGRVVRAETTEEPEWTQEDMDGAFSLRKYEAGLCPNCKHPLSETADASHEFSYHAGLPIRCHRCTAQEIASEAYQNAKNPNPRSVFIPISLRGEENDPEV